MWDNYSEPTCGIDQVVGNVAKVQLSPDVEEILPIEMTLLHLAEHNLNCFPTCHQGPHAFTGENLMRRCI